MLNYNKNLKQVSQKLRGSMTDAEKLLWSKLKGKQLKGLQFYRQKIIGNYIVDFYCAKAGLVIEVDGGQHYTEAGCTADADRDLYLRSCGLRVLRYSNSDVLRNVEGVVESIYAIV
jgi:very-short-patch-repair endonuclease